MDQKQAWEAFCATGSVAAYLEYARLARGGCAARKGSTHADQNGRARHSGVERGGK